MARTTAIAVKNILLDNYDTLKNPDLTGFIDTASALVDESVNFATERGITLSTTLQERIEAWLAAHYYAQADPLYMSKSTQGASGSFQGQSAMGLEGTRYGQQAKRLDISGGLSSFDNNARATVLWLGSDCN
jgi:hypothetical protein